MKECVTSAKKSLRTTVRDELGKSVLFTFAMAFPLLDQLKSKLVWETITCPRANKLRVQWNAKGGEIRDTKTFNLSRNIVSLQVFVDVSRFSPCVINLTRNKNICCRLKKCGALIGWFARARANLLRDKLWIWWKTSNKAKICCSK